MSKISLQGDPSGTGTFTIAAPNSNSNPTLTLPTTSGTVVVTGGAQTIEFAAGSASTPSITFTGDTNTGIFSPAADTIAFAEGGAEAMRIDSSGNVFVGGTDNLDSNKFNIIGAKTLNAGIPQAQLAVGDTTSLATGTGGGIAFLAKYNANDLTTMGSVEGVRENGTSGNYAGALVFKTRANGGNNNERARITSGGNFFVGTTSTANPGASLISNGEINSTVSSGNCIQFWNQATTGNNGFATFYTEGGNGALRGTIDYNRGAALTRYNTTSDATLKNIIGDADGQKSVEILNSTRIREYAWKDDPTQKPQIGVIAQELYETYKGAVSVGGDVEKTDEDGNVTTEYKPWAVDKTAFTFHLIAGWQAHEKIIQELKAELDTVKAKLSALKGN